MANNTDNKNEKTGLEERFSMIEDILGKMEDEDVTLDQSFDLYKQGIEQIKAANADLDRIEKAMLVINEDGELEEFYWTLQRKLRYGPQISNREFRCIFRKQKDISIRFLRRWITVSLQVASGFDRCLWKLPMRCSVERIRRL